MEARRDLSKSRVMGFGLLFVGSLIGSVSSILLAWLVNTSLDLHPVIAPIVMPQSKLAEVTFEFGLELAIVLLVGIVVIISGIYLLRRGRRNLQPKLNTEKLEDF